MPRPARFSLSLAAAVFAAWATAARADDPALTIYNQNFAVVRETARLDLKKGANAVTFSDVTALLEPDSVVLRDPTGKRRLQIVEQNFRADTASQERLLALYEGKTIDFLAPPAPGTEGPGRIVRGKIVRASGVFPATGMPSDDGGFDGGDNNPAGAGGPIVEVDGKLRFGLPGTPLFPAPADGSLLLKPTLEWTLETDQGGPLAAELAYVSGGFTWKANYNLVAPETGDTVDLVGWVTMNNNSGRTFEDARVQLMAGDVSKIQRREVYFSRGGYPGAGGYAAVPPPVTEKSFDEYHLYTLQRRTTLRDRQTKQVEFARAEAVKAARLYVYDGAKRDANRYRGYSSQNLRSERDYGTQSNNKVWVMREFANTKANGLGIPLPKGRVRFYRREAVAGAGSSDALQFIGENTIDHTPQGETLRVYTGDAFDLVGERRQTGFKVQRGQFVDESFKITLRNRKKESAEIRVVETLYRSANGKITQKSDPFTKKDFQTIEFRVTLKPGEERKITYTVHYT